MYWLDRRRAMRHTRLQQGQHLYVCDWCGQAWRTRFAYWLHWSWLGEVR